MGDARDGPWPAVRSFDVRGGKVAHMPRRANICTVRERRNSMDFEGYCVKCRKKQSITEGKVGETAKGRPMAKGTCPECGTTVTRFLSKKEAGK